MRAPPRNPITPRNTKRKAAPLNNGANLGRWPEPSLVGALLLIDRKLSRPWCHWLISHGRTNKRSVSVHRSKSFPFPSTGSLKLNFRENISRSHNDSNKVECQEAISNRIIMKSKFPSVPLINVFIDYCTSSHEKIELFFWYFDCRIYSLHYVLFANHLNSHFHKISSANIDASTRRRRVLICRSSKFAQGIRILTRFCECSPSWVTSLFVGEGKRIAFDSVECLTGRRLSVAQITMDGCPGTVRSP